MKMSKEDQQKHINKLYNDASRIKKEREQKQQLQSESEDEFYSFQPQINTKKNQKKEAEQNNTSLDVGERLYLKHKLKQLNQTQDNGNLSDTNCTYKPQICKMSTRIMNEKSPSGRNVFEELNALGKNRSQTRGEESSFDQKVNVISKPRH